MDIVSLIHAADIVSNSSANSDPNHLPTSPKAEPQQNETLALQSSPTSSSKSSSTPPLQQQPPSHHSNHQLPSHNTCSRMNIQPTSPKQQYQQRDEFEVFDILVKMRNLNRATAPSATNNASMHHQTSPEIPKAMGHSSASPSPDFRLSPPVSLCHSTFSDRSPKASLSPNHPYLRPPSADLLKQHYDAAILSPNMDRERQQEIMRVLEPPRPFLCSWPGCGKAFPRKPDLTRHARIHQNLRPYKCTYEGCGKAFSQRSALKVHTRIHTGEKPHQCEFPSCGKSFSDSSSLARHRKLHTIDGLSYPCDYPGCAMKFTKKVYMLRHKKIAHFSRHSSGAANIGSTAYHSGQGF